MARKRKGDNISGWLIIDKPKGMTSTAVVNKARWALNAQKAGHAGTLDPDATGLLAVAFGDATKTIPYITDALKAYEFSVRFGEATNTDDADGEIIAQSDLRPTDDAIRECLPAFLGDIMQVPPKFSAVKIDGQRAYKLARDGDDPQIEARPLWMEELLFVDRPSPESATFEMTCGKGGYVRSIARDLGKMLECYAHVTDLRRLWSGPFDIETSTPFDTLDALAKTPQLKDQLLPLEVGLAELPEVVCPAQSLPLLQNGGSVSVIAQNIDYGTEVWASYDGQAVAIGRYMGGTLQPSRVFQLPVNDTEQAV